MCRYPSAIRSLQLQTGGVRPGLRCRAERALSLAEREEVSRGLAADLSVRTIAAGIGRAASTVSREITRNGGRRGYRACAADRRALRQARRPKTAKIAGCRRLRAAVEDRLEHCWSPRQIAEWLPRAFPDDPEMRVSHETIYMSLYVQGRGALRAELRHALRSGRAIRRSKKHAPVGRGQIPDMVMISERPAEVADRAVPGHWEGDLIMGSGKTCIGTLVERSTRYLILLKVEKNTAEQVRTSMATQIQTLPEQLRTVPGLMPLPFLRRMVGMPNKYPKEQRDRATRMALDRLTEYPSAWAAAQALGPKLGVGAETLRKWIVQAQVDGGMRSGPTSEELAEIKRLRSENQNQLLG
jgi:IS30 family transposase/transposase-like protein